MMTKKDIENLEQIAIDALKKGITREEALRSLMNAGILDKDGNHTEPYKHLGEAIRKYNVRRKA